MKSVVFLLFALLSYCLGKDEVYRITAVNVTQVTDVEAPHPRIVGGSATVIENYPYTVQVLYNSRLSCGGSLLTRRHVLSAAHCFVDGNGVAINPRNYNVRAGTTSLSGGVTSSVSTIIIHEQYNVPVRDNDVAVLVLSSAFTFSSRIAAATIPLQGNVVPDSAPVQHVGWGITNPNIAQASSVLNEVTIATVNRTICRARYAWLQTLTNEPFPVTENMICAGLLDIGGKDACQGDSGGPLLYRGIVVGVTSWGFGCGEPLFPGVSARVASYTNWINRTVTVYNKGTSFAAPMLTTIVTITLLTSRITSSL